MKMVRHQAVAIDPHIILLLILPYVIKESQIIFLMQEYFGLTIAPIINMIRYVCLNISNRRAHSL